MLGFQAAPRLFSGQADEQFCLCSSEYEMSTCVIYCTNSHVFKGGVFYFKVVSNRTVISVDVSTCVVVNVSIASIVRFLCCNNNKNVL